MSTGAPASVGALPVPASLADDDGRALWPETCHGRWMSEGHEPGLVSVIVPAYNRARLIVETLNSVLAQTCRPIELVVVDDGSTDGTGQVVEAWRRERAADGGLRVRCLRQPKLGAPAARNHGLIESRGEYIQLLDSDDLLHPQKLATQVDQLAGDRALSLAYCETAVFREEPDWLAEPCAGRPAKDLVEASLGAVAWTVESPVYRRGTCLDNGPWAEQLRRWDDWEYNMRLVARGPRVRHTPAVLSLVREHGAARISTLDFTVDGLAGMLKAARGVERILTVTGRLTEKTRRGLASRYFCIVWGACAQGFGEIARQAAERGLHLRAGAVKWSEFETFRLISALPPAEGAGVCRLLSAVAAVARGIIRKPCVEAVRRGMPPGTETRRGEGTSRGDVDDALWPGTCHGRWMDARCEPGLVSVLVPTYNRAGLIEETLDSVAAQTYRPIELVIVDDGGTDDTLQVVERWAGESARAGDLVVRCYRVEHGGHAAARNLGLLKSRGQYIQFLDSDDLLGVSKVARHVEALAAVDGMCAAYGNWREFEDKGGAVDVYDTPPWNGRPCGLRDWLEGRFMPPHCLLWRREDLVRLGPWDEDLVADVDGEYAMRFLGQGGALRFCDGAWAYYRRGGPDQVSRRRNSRALLSRLDVARRVERVLAAKGALDSEHLLALARRYADLADTYVLRQWRLGALCCAESRRLRALAGRRGQHAQERFLMRFLGALKQHLAHLVRTRLGKEYPRPVASVGCTRALLDYDDK